MKEKKILDDEAVRKLVSARLSILSPETIIAFGSDGSFSRDELLQHVAAGDSIGEKIAQVQLEWLRSLKEGLV